MIDLSIIIVSYNVKHFLQRTLESVFCAQGELKLEVFVVDNASEDGSVEMVRSLFPEVNVIDTGANLGFAKANNIALKQAAGKFLMLLNPDCILQEDTLKVLLDFLKEHQEAGAVGPKMLNRDGTFQITSKRGIPTIWASFCKLSGISSVFPNSRFFNRYELGHLDPDEINQIEILTGAAIMIRREVYEQVGGLDEDYFMYGEDIDWCYEIIKAGWKIYYVPATKIVHYKGESTRGNHFDREKHFYNAMRLFNRKHSHIGIFSRIIIEFGIFIGEMAARLKKNSNIWLPGIMDFAFTFAILALSFYTRFAFFPSVWGPPPMEMTNGMWIVSTLYGLSTAVTLALTGVYNLKYFSIRSVLISIIISYVLVSTIAYFVTSIQFSRIVIIASLFLVMAVLPGWRYVLLMMSGEKRRRRVIIVGTDNLGKSIVKRSLNGQLPDLEVVGWAVYDSSELGSTIMNLPVLGMATELAEFAKFYNIDEALFSSGAAKYEDIFRISSENPVKGLLIQIIPQGFDQDDEMPLLELDLGGSLWRNLVHTRRPQIVVRKR
ncbi:MAG: glycosyltransferase [Candidatus Electryonea clarkiae]|nr:glycosyltransferase [Candidatus Electryonea clarkiae]MDP8286036.1 glycosyltransferase [Candidatus Electryonea clarkiae]